MQTGLGCSRNSGKVKEPGGEEWSLSGAGGMENSSGGSCEALEATGDNLLFHANCGGSR